MTAPSPIRRLPPAASATRIGVAVAADRVVVAAGSGLAEIPVARDVWTGDAAAPVAAAIGRALDELRADPRSVTFVLLPPHALVREVELPPMTRAEAERAIGRDASRHFATARGEQVVAVESTASAGRFIAAAAPATLVEALHRAASDCRIAVAAVVPAAAAWAAAAGSDTTLMLVADAREAVVIRVVQGRLEGVQVCRAANAERIAGLLGSAQAAGASRRIGAWAAPDVVGAVAEALRAGGHEMALAQRSGESPAALAARHATPSAALPLVHAAEHGRRAARARSLTRALAAAALVFAIIAAGATLWGARRELAAIRAERARISPRVEPAVAVSAGLQSASDRAAAAAAIAQSSTPWDVQLGAVASALPADAHLTAFHAAGDSVVVQGQAFDAGAVLLALRQIPGVRAVRATAPFRQETGADGERIESFALALTFGARSAR